jgi:hypothetical protein|tara:strand:- start:1911 stop:2078 length:168 start_codon:yes stop_codon:yes gene_type:complete
MSVQNPPITEQPALDFTLLEMVRLLNDLEQQNIKLLKDIRESTNFADLQSKVNAQ